MEHRCASKQDHIWPGGGRECTVATRPRPDRALWRPDHPTQRCGGWSALLMCPKMGFGLSKRRSSQSSAGMRPDGLGRLRAHARWEQTARFTDLVKLQVPLFFSFKDAIRVSIRNSKWRGEIKPFSESEYWSNLRRECRRGS